MKNLITLIAAVALSVAFVGCKKDKKDEKKTDDTTKPTGDTKPTDTKPDDTKPDDTKPTETKPPVPMVELTGTPSENMIKVFAAGAEAIKTAEPATAATILTEMLKKYDVADLRAKSKAAKEAGKGATDDQIKAFKAAKEAYKTRAAELGKKDAAAFGDAAAAWAKAWGIN